MQTNAPDTVSVHDWNAWCAGPLAVLFAAIAASEWVRHYVPSYVPQAEMSYTAQAIGAVISISITCSIVTALYQPERAKRMTVSALGPGCFIAWFVGARVKEHLSVEGAEVTVLTMATAAMAFCVAALLFPKDVP